MAKTNMIPARLILKDFDLRYLFIYLVVNVLSFCNRKIILYLHIHCKEQS